MLTARASNMFSAKVIKKCQQIQKTDPMYKCAHFLWMNNYIEADDQCAPHEFKPYPQYKLAPHSQNKNLYEVKFWCNVLIQAPDRILIKKKTLFPAKR